MNRLLLLFVFFICLTTERATAQDYIITNANDTIAGTIIEHTIKTVTFRSQADNKKHNYRVGKIKGFSSNGFGFSSRTAGQGSLFLLDHIARDTSYYTSSVMYNVRIQLGVYKDIKVYHVIMGEGGSTKSGAPMTFADHRYLFENTALGLRDVLGSEIAYENLKAYFAGNIILMQDVLLTNGRYGSRFIDNLLAKYAAGASGN